MDFRLTDEQRQLQATVRDFARAELSAIAVELERDSKPPSHELVRRYAEMGFLGINVPTALGGLGTGNIEALVVLEEFPKISSAVAFPIFESSVGPVRAIKHFAPAALRDRVGPMVRRDEMVIAVSMSEPDAGSALTDLETRGVVRGDKVVLNGTKRWCSGGGHSDAYLVYCRLSDEPGAKSIGAAADLASCGQCRGRAAVGARKRDRQMLHNTIAREVTGDALQLMGAYGYSKEFPMERRNRDGWGWGIAGGAIDIQKTNIASAMLGRRFDQRR